MTENPERIPGNGCLTIPNAKTYAIAGIRSTGEAGDRYQVDFYTCFKDRPLLITPNGKDD